MDTIIIKACLNGGRGREQNPNVPWTPEEVAAEAKRCADAGASIVHIHARTANGGTSYDPAWYAEADRLIRAQTNLIVNHTTARLPDASIDQVLRYLRETPEPVDMVSLNAGTIVLNAPLVNGVRRTLAIPNSYDDIRQIILACRERGITPEPAVLDTGFLSTVATLVQDGLLPFPRYLLLEFSGRFGDGLQIMPGAPRSYFYMAECVKELFPGAIWAAHGIEDSVFTIASLAIATGAHVRIGFEDRATLVDGSLARSSADFVSWAVFVARAHGREPATPQEARRMIGLPQK
ncbi:MAG TPA: 3-keto-5-aminohexanoate cleavage protein [Methylomirabilota bacterium]|jgi:3-keto-5-aminohexanoate cleavage enzyme|nr:3-keto-5-aminohexanoate cleavage protein [Methylomirabilota bacterium]